MLRLVVEDFLASSKWTVYDGYKSLKETKTIKRNAIKNTTFSVIKHEDTKFTKNTKE